MIDVPKDPSSSMNLVEFRINYQGTGHLEIEKLEIVPVIKACDGNECP
jgi:hypothetical protein